MTTLDELRARGCRRIAYQQDGAGPWVIAGPDPRCPVHGDDDDDD
ncbi:MAG: hypothetical protein ACRDOK_21075 [Streptosporangiaceae bacterium]